MTKESYLNLVEQFYKPITLYTKDIPEVAKLVAIRLFTEGGEHPQTNKAKCELVHVTRKILKNLDESELHDIESIEYNF